MPSSLLVQVRKKWMKKKSNRKCEINEEWCDGNGMKKCQIEIVWMAKWLSREPSVLSFISPICVLGCVCVCGVGSCSAHINSTTPSASINSRLFAGNYHHCVCNCHGYTYRLCCTQQLEFVHCSQSASHHGIVDRLHDDVVCCHWAGAHFCWLCKWLNGFYSRCHHFPCRFVAHVMIHSVNTRSFSAFQTRKYRFNNKKQMLRPYVCRFRRTANNAAVEVEGKQTNIQTSILRIG